ncbi:methionine--tRNA ligase [Pseudovibrio sp. Ad26]|uniref:methionine--tRNA ligase n=1 Tax=Pseudovibrio sp. Ad26 TaxID=989410 RepID=UPI0007AEA818|nr:methionine--tRNA ligase [Pseudovibrio sp. Ad26]KZL07204.1 Methionine--tRNA ligase [Pseudovibrio sp. Ad26]
MKRILITSALPYINGTKHLGNLAGSMLPADAYARFQRAMGNEVLYICATDEHGTPAEIAATKAGQDIQTFCTKQHDVQAQVGKAFGMSWNWFGRTSSSANKYLTQHFGEVLARKGLIEERTDQMIFSPDDERFLPDRYVEGNCPHCQFDSARGDQCDNCGELLDPVDLINPYSVISNARNLEVRPTKHLHLRLSKLQETVKIWVDERAQNWPSLTRSIAYKHLNEGVSDRGITRDLSWGVPVTKNGKIREGFEAKVYYVWFDAPIGYIAATMDWAEHHGSDWKRWWRVDQGADDVTYVQFMGKDNVAFHTVSFPATLLGSGEPWKTVDQLKSFNWLNWYGGKFSTSQQRGVFMDQALKILPADYWRWYILSNAPENDDSAFTWERFQVSVNSDLADVLGNFVNRVFRFAHSRFDGKIPTITSMGALEDKLVKDLSQSIETITSHFEAMEYRKATRELRRLWVKGNEYFQSAEPWSKIKTDPQRAGTSVYIALSLIQIIARLSAPFVPFTSEKIFMALGKQDKLTWPTKDALDEITSLQSGENLGELEVLFRKICTDDIENWSTVYGGALSV